MRHIILSLVACLALPQFFELYDHRHDFQERVNAHEMWVLIFSTIIVRNVSYAKESLVKYCHNCTKVFMYSIRYSCQIFNEN